MKIQFIFITEKYGEITNERPYIEEAETDEEFGGCIVDFDNISMLQDYEEYANKIWCGELQWDYPSAGLIKVRTEIVD